MIFTDDTTAALNFVAALADTVPEASESGEDELATTAQLNDPVSYTHLTLPTILLV